MGLSAGIVPRSILTPSPNQYRRSVVSALLFFGNTTSYLSTHPVGLREFHGENPSNTQSTSPRPLIFGKYPPPKTVRTPLSGRRIGYGHDSANGGGMIARQLAERTLPTPTVA